MPYTEFMTQRGPVLHEFVGSILYIEEGACRGLMMGGQSVKAWSTLMTGAGCAELGLEQIEGQRKCFDHQTM